MHLTGAPDRCVKLLQRGGCRQTGSGIQYSDPQASAHPLGALRAMCTFLNSALQTSLRPPLPGAARGA